MSEVGRLFGMLERGPTRVSSFGRGTPGVDDPTQSGIIGQTTNIPLEMSNVAQDLGFPLPDALAVAGGVYNGNFMEGPEDGSQSTIDDQENKLPGWSFSSTTGDIYCIWQDGSPPSVIFKVNKAAPVGATAYIEAFVPVTQIGRVFRPKATTAVLLSHYKATMDVDFFDTDGASTSSSKQSTRTDITLLSQDIDQWRSPQWGTEVFARIRLGIEVITANVDADAQSGVQFWDVWTAPPAMYDITIPFYRSTWSPSSSSSYTIRTNEDVAFGVGSYIATASGFFMGLSGQTDASITGGKATMYLRNVTTGTNIDILGTSPGETRFNTSYSNIRAERLLDKAATGGASYDFEIGDELSLRMETTAPWASGSGDWTFFVRLLQVLTTDQTPSGGSPGSGWTIAG